MSRHKAHIYRNGVGGRDHYNQPHTKIKDAILKGDIQSEGLNFFLMPFDEKEGLYEVRVQDKRGEDGGKKTTLTPWILDALRFNVVMDKEDLQILAKFFSDAAKLAK